MLGVELELDGLVDDVLPVVLGLAALLSFTVLVLTSQHWVGDAAPLGVELDPVP